MAINLKFDLMGNPEPPSIVLANRNGNKLGQLNVNVESIDVKDVLETSEFSFTLNKYVDNKITNLWDKVVDFKLVYCPEWDLWYEIKVELDEATETIKTVFCTQLGQAELSQIKVYNTEINTEADIARDDYKISILYDEDNPDASIFHRVMSKAPHYSIAHVDESLKRIQKSFSFDDSSIVDVFDEIEEEVGCLVVYNSNSDKGGKPKRDISVYDLLQNCKNPSCKHRGEFTDKCPKCGGIDIDYGYGEDTTIFVTSDELATQGIQLVTDVDSVKNCFKLEAGDDLMTATIRNCNPNGSDYIWYFSNSLKEDMSNELVEKLESYDEKYQDYYNKREYTLDENLVGQYNNLVNKYQDYYKTKSNCINCKYEGYFEDECPSCHSKNILSGKRLQSIDSTVTGYPDLMTAYYNTIDLELYLKSGLMPTVGMSDTNAEEQLNLLTSSALSPVAVNVENINNVSLATANSAVLSMAKVIIRPTYKVEIKSSTLSDDKVWRGQFIIANYSDETDTATNNEGEYINVTINNDTEEFIKQKIEKALNKENTDDLSISGLFNEEKYNYTQFCDELKKYALNPLKSFYEACDTCLSILTEQGTGNEDEKPDLYESLYEPYYNKSLAIAEEIKTREDEIAIIVELQEDITNIQSQIQDALDFEQHLGEDLWLEFCAYRREDKYSNSNYISDGLNNAELFEKANEFIDVAEKEIFKSAELQHSISATLNNLLAHPKFKHLLKYFKTGNWIRVQVDDRIFKLRLLEYEFNYGDLENIPVEFSDVTKVKNGTTDVRDIVSQAASMASSYDAVQRQAKKGDVARSTIDQWLVDGLNAANMQIVSNDSEEVLLTKNGLLARSYDDITGTYSPEQLKITHNIMAYTDDNWETVRQSIGKHEYKYFDEDTGKLDETIGYGMNADFANAAVLCGSQIIGGDIYSNNYEKTKDEDGNVVSEIGSYIDLEQGHFSLAGGKLRYDGGDLTIVGEIEVTTSGRIGCWDINGTSIYKGSAAFGDANGMYFGTNGLSLSDKFKVKPDGIATMTNANVSGTITASDIIGNNIEGGTITGAEITGGTITAGNTLYIGSQKDKDGNIIANSHSAWIDIDGVLNTNDAHINGTITAVDGNIGGFTIETTETNEDGSKSGGWLYSGESIGSDKSIFLSATDMQGNANFFDETIGDWRLTIGSNFGVTSDGTTYMSDCEITGGSLRMGNINDGYSAWISVDEGVLNANGVNISGTINAVEGHIGSWTLDSQALYYHSVYSTGLCSIEEKFDSNVLTFEFDDTTSTYKVKKCDTNAVNVKIPSEYNGYSVTSIGYQAFYNCTELTNIEIPTSIRSISDFAFRNCLNLTTVVIPNSVTTIALKAFLDCSKLKTVYIPNSVTSMEGYIFQNCNATIYCKAVSKPSGWDANWISGSNGRTIWGYEANYDYYSLVTLGATSFPRIFVGATSNGVPQPIHNPNFLVLNDGSLYANAAQIKGHIEATSGSFTGEIKAETGYIGGLNISTNGISSDNGKLAFNSNGDIVTEIFEAENVKTAQISGRISGSPSLTFETTSNEMEDVIATITTAVTKQGEQSGTEITNAGEVTITVITNKALTAAKTFKIYTSYYNEFWDNSRSIQTDITVLAGETTATATVPHIQWFDAFGGIRARYTCNDIGSKQEYFTQISKTATNNITASANFVPSASGLTLGSSTMYWATAYATDLRASTINGREITLGSDKRLKDNIADINYDFSEQLINRLTPKSYTLKTEQTSRTHYGFIAQEVEELLGSLGKNANEVGIVCKPLSDESGGNNNYYSLNYIDLIAPMVSVIQQLSKRVKELEDKNVNH